jgi:uncharacterized protein (TIGR02147 family)
MGDLNKYGGLANAAPHCGAIPCDFFSVERSRCTFVYVLGFLWIWPVEGAKRLGPMAELLLKDPRDYIKFEHELRRARRQSYSMRAFARDLSVSPSSLNDFLKGRVGMSRSRIESIAEKLKWSEMRKEHFIDLVQAKFDKDPGVRQTSLMKSKARLKNGSYGLSLDSFKVISDWYHLVIRELCDVKEGMTVAKIAKELSLSPLTAGKAVKRLLKLELLKETENGLKPTEFGSHFGDEAPSEAIVEFHTQILELAQKAMRDVPFEDRESHSLIFSVPKENLPKMHAELKTAILQIANKYAHGQNMNTIQALSLQVFPVWEEKGLKK